MTEPRRDEIKGGADGLGTESAADAGIAARVGWQTGVGGHQGQVGHGGGQIQLEPGFGTAEVTCLADSQLDQPRQPVLHHHPALPVPGKGLTLPIPEFFTWLHESTASSSPTGIPIGPDEAVVGASSTSQDLGMDAPALERIRFAAANRLCVDLGYQGDMKRVEPYSLRWNRGGIVMLYACEAGTSAYMAYQVSGISKVEIIEQTFVPKYANELLPPIHPS